MYFPAGKNRKSFNVCLRETSFETLIFRYVDIKAQKIDVMLLKNLAQGKGKAKSTWYKFKNTEGL